MTYEINATYHFTIEPVISIICCRFNLFRAFEQYKCKTYKYEGSENNSSLLNSWIGWLTWHLNKMDIGNIALEEPVFAKNSRNNSDIKISYVQNTLKKHSRKIMVWKLKNSKNTGRACYYHDETAIIEKNIIKYKIF